jgi:hypothetical protein
LGSNLVILDHIWFFLIPLSLQPLEAEASGDGDVSSIMGVESSAPPLGNKPLESLRHDVEPRVHLLVFLVPPVGVGPHR